MNEVARLRGIAKGYRSGPGRIEVLRDLDLVLTTGEMVAVVGESGVGKSTLLHLLGALDRPDAGEYLFRGAAVLAGPPEALARFRNRHVGFVFQFHHLLPEFTALENVQLPGMIRRLPRSERTERARVLLEEMGLSSRLHHRPAELSGGEQQRVAIARAIASEPDLLLADEPTGNLDPQTSVQVFAALRRAHQRRPLTTVLATHNERLAEECDRVLLLANGGLALLDDAARRAYYSPRA
jgi:lipoprotein-releasing system ATP-binding protein